MKRVLLLAPLVPFLASCTTTPAPRIKTVPVPKEPTVNTTKSQKEEYIYASVPLVLKADSLSRPPSWLEFSVDFKGGTLEDFCNYLQQRGFLCRVEPSLRFKDVPPLRGEFKLGQLLEKVGVLTSSYGEYSDGVVSFVSKKVVIYQVPLLSGDYRRVLFKTSDDDVLSSVDTDLFKELSDKITALLSNFSVKASTQVSINYTKKEEREDSSENKRAQSEKRGSKTDLLNQDTTSLKTSRSNSSTSTSERKMNSTSEKGVKLGSKKSRASSKKGGGEALLPKPYSFKEDENTKYESGATTENISTVREGQKNKTSSKQKTIAKEKAVLVQNAVKRGISYEAVEEGKVEIEKLYQSSNPVAILPSSGLVVAVVNRETESLLDSLFEEVKRELSQMVSLKIVIVELSEKDAKNFTLTLNLLRRAWRKEFSGQIDSNQLNLSFTSLSQDYLSGIASGIDISTLLGYIKSRSDAKVVSSVEILTLSRELARLKNAIGIPYLEPQNISVGGTNPTLSYSIKYVYDGFDLKLIPSVVGGRVFLSLSMIQNQYLGDKTIQAGSLGQVQVPIQAPKVINTTLACRSGDIVFLGGLKKYKKSSEATSNLSVPTSNSKDREYKEVFVFIQPKLIKFKSR